MRMAKRGQHGRTRPSKREVNRITVPDGMKAINVADSAFADLENTANIMNISVNEFVEMLASSAKLPEGESGLISYRQSLNETPLSWFHIRQNMPRILNGKPLKLLHDKAKAFPHLRPALIIANGPSLTDERIQMIKHADFQHRGGVILCVDSAAKRVLNAGIYPHFIVHLDNRIYAREFYKGVMLSEINKRLYYIMPIDMHPEVVAMARGEIHWFNIASPDFPNMNKNAYLQFMFPEIPCMDSGGNVGTFGIILAKYLQCNPVALIGFDLSWREGMKPEDSENFYLDVIDSGGQPVFDDNGRVEDIIWPCDTSKCPNDLVFDGECSFPGTRNPDDRLCPKELYGQYVTVEDKFGNKRVVEKIYDMYIQILEQRMRYLQKEYPEFQVYNCSEEGLAYVDGMKECSLMEFFEEWSTKRIVRKREELV
jgi:hypothetical protein